MVYEREFKTISSNSRNYNLLCDYTMDTKGQIRCFSIFLFVSALVLLGKAERIFSGCFSWFLFLTIIWHNRYTGCKWQCKLKDQFCSALSGALQRAEHLPWPLKASPSATEAISLWIHLHAWVWAQKSFLWSLANVGKASVLNRMYECFLWVGPLFSVLHLPSLSHRALWYWEIQAHLSTPTLE